MPTTSHLLARAMSPSLLDHLHASFLSGRAADVVLRVLSPWRAEYRMHKVVLLQAGFFEMLFEGGYREALGEGKPVELRFEDPNITRAAFELCLSHLYHPTPLPALPASYIPSAAYPLGPAFPHAPPPSAVPRLLLSLLATASYLHIPALVTESSRILLASVSPWTVSRYLGFAIGLGLGSPTEGAEAGSDEGVKGLGRSFTDSPLPSASTSRAPSVLGRDEEDSPDPPSTVGEDSDDDLLTSGKLTATASGSPSGTPVPSSPTKAQLLTSYGTPTNLLGQTCVSFLCRWGADLLLYEESTPFPGFTIFGHHGLPAQWVRAILSADEFWVREEMQRWEVCRRVLDLRREGWARERGAWGRGGREEREEEREWEALVREGVYYSHMTFDNLQRIADAVSPHTGKPYTPLRVLQKAHWAASLLRGQVMSSLTHAPPNGKPGEMGLLRSTEALLAIASAHASGTDGVQEGDDREEAEEEFARAWYAVPPDDAQRIGDWNPAGVVSAAVTAQQGGMSGNGTGKTKTGWDERVWFGVGNKRRTLREIAGASGVSVPGSGSGSGSGGNALLGLERSLGWTQYEPYRFSVEFFSAASLKLDKSRPTTGTSSGSGNSASVSPTSKIHSRTIFYAGSFFNVYIQVVKRKKDDKDVGSGPNAAPPGDKETQLGVYVQRWSMVNPVPAASAPPVPTPGTATSQHRREDSAASVHSLNAFASTLTPAAPSTTAATVATSTGAPPGSIPLHMAATWHPGPANPNRAATPSPIPFPRATTPRLATSASASALSRSASPPIPGTPTAVHSPGPPTPGGSAQNQNQTTPTQTTQNQSPPSAFPFPPSSSGGLTPTTPLSTSPVSYPPSAPQTPYRDPRQTLRAYFSVTCCSSLGAVLTRFSSAPDKFDVGQSWGWKSSCLREGAGEEGGEGGLRVSVVIGLV